MVKAALPYIDVFCAAWVFYGMRLYSQPLIGLFAAVFAAAAVACGDEPMLPGKGPMIALSPPTANIFVGDTTRFSVTFDRADEKASWSTSSPGVVVVDATGIVRGVSPGQATVSVASSTTRPIVRAAAFVSVVAR